MNQIMNQTNETEVDVLAIHEHVVFNPTEEAPAVIQDVPPVPEAEEKIFKLHRHIAVDGVEVSELRFDFDKLTSADFMNIEQDMTVRSIAVVKNAAYSDTYCLFVAARACGISIDFLKALHAKDHARVVGEVQAFLLVTE